MVHPNETESSSHDPNAVARKFFRKAIETPSPCGFEEPIQELVRRYIAPHAEHVRTDIHGNLIASAGDPDGTATDVCRA